MRFDDDDARRSIVRLAVAVTVADGQITPAERDTLERLDHLGLGALSGIVDEEIARAMCEPVDIHTVCSGLVAAGPQVGAVIVAALAAIAASDHSLAVVELETLGAIALQLGLVPEETEAIVTAAVDAYAARFDSCMETKRGEPPTMSAPACALSGSAPAFRTRSLRPPRVPWSTQGCAVRSGPPLRHCPRARAGDALHGRAGR